MINKGITFAIILIAMIAGSTLAAATSTPTIKILPESGPNVQADGTILVPEGVDAAISVGLAAEYTDFTPGSVFNQHVEDSSAILVPGTAQTGGLGASPDTELEHWTPTTSDIGKTFTVVASATNQIGKRKQYVTVTAPAQPVPELSTGILATTGLIGLIGLVKYRRKND